MEVDYDYMRLVDREQIHHIRMKDAKAVVERGLKYFLGDNAQWLPEYDEVSEWLTDNDRKGLMLFGMNGRGKTVMCKRIFPVIWKYYLRRNYYAVDAILIGELYRNTIDQFRLLGGDDILIDDVGVESISNNFGEKIDVFSMIVDLAEKHGRLVVLTTNLTPNEISERYGERTLDRLRGIVRTIRIEGESLRV